MSSDDDEFYDAPNAFPSSNFSKWSDSNEDLSLTALEIVSKNAERRNRVESLRHNVSINQSFNFSQDNAKDVLVAEDENPIYKILTTDSVLHEADRHVNQPLLEAVLYQQNLIKRLRDDPNLCQCMKNLLNTISTQVPEMPSTNKDHVRNLSTQITQSCPECCKPIHSLGNALGLHNVLNNFKSWSLDTARVGDSEKRIIKKDVTKEYSRTVPTDIVSNNKTSLDVQQFASDNKVICQNCQHPTELNPSIQNQHLYTSDKNYSMINDDRKMLSGINSYHCGVKPSKFSGLENFSRHDSMKLYKTSSKENTLIPNSNDQKVKSLTNTLNADFPPEMNPIEVQFRERTKSMEKLLKENRNSSLQKSEESERLRESIDFSQRAIHSLGGKVKRLHKNVKSAWSAVSRAKIFSQDEELSSEDEEFVGNRGIRLRSSRRMKGQRDFLQIKLVQEMKDEHTGAIWAMRFSPCGRLLATAGYDRAIRVWVLRQYYWYFKQYQKSTVSNSTSEKIDCDFDITKQAVMNEEEIIGVGGIDSVSLASTSVSTGKTDGCGVSTCSSGDDDIEQGRRTPFRSKPLIIYRGHEGVITDLVWSKNLFLLATSMDRQVRLWHISRRECLCIFNHNDTVPTIVFHPKDDRYFLSGSLDGKLRLWNIPDKKIRYWVEALLPNSLPISSVFFSTRSVSASGASSAATGIGSGNSSSTSLLPKTVITCAAFVCEATKIAIGTYDGRVLFYTSELQYITSMAIKSSHGKSRHCRVTAIELDPTDSCKILVTSNDSRVRLIDARDYHITCKYRGLCNFSSQIRASFSPTGKYIISGSENNFFYIWKKDVEVNRMTRFSTTRKDRNNYWEAIRAHNTVVSVSVFNPAPHLVLDKKFRRRPNFTATTINMSAPGSTISGMGSPGLCGSLSGPTDQSVMLGANSLSTSGLSVPPSVAYLGEVIASADINGVIKVFKNRIHSHPVSVSK